MKWQLIMPVAVPVAFLVGAALGDRGTWSTLAVAALASLVSLAIFRRGRTKEQVSPSGPERHERIGVVRLPSARPDTHFRLTARVHWLTAPGNDDEDGAAAIDAVVARARATAAECDPDDVTVLEDELAKALAMPRRDPRQVEVWADEIKVMLPESLQRHYEELTELRQKAARWELKVEQDRKIRDYLQNDALASRSNAVTWWLAEHPYEVEKGVELIDALGQLSAAASGSSAEEEDGPRIDADSPYRNVTTIGLRTADGPSGMTVDELLDSPDVKSRPFAAAQLADTVARFGNVPAAERIRRACGVDVPPPAASTGVGATANGTPVHRPASLLDADPFDQTDGDVPPF
jgi:hypothetical protein